MNSEKHVILMVEDEERVLAVNKRMLKRRGYEIITATTVKEAKGALNETKPDLLILDIMLPDGSGYDICNYFREEHDQPVIFLTGKTETRDKVEGMASGGDYYLTKPYNFDEFIAVIERLLEREETLKKKQMYSTMIKKGDLTLNIMKSTVDLRGEDVGLTKKEFALLLFFMQNQDKELSQEALYEAAWGVPAHKDARVVRTHISNLRNKIGADESDDYDIVSAYGKGYTFVTV